MIGAVVRLQDADQADLNRSPQSGARPLQRMGGQQAIPPSVFVTSRRASETTQWQQGLTLTQLATVHVVARKECRP